MRDYSARDAKIDADGKKVTRRRLMAYSLPIALSTAVVLAWVFRSELHLVPSAENQRGKVSSRSTS
jgi:hypothetical protein